MKIKNIDYPTPLSAIKDPDDHNIDVFVELEDGTEYTLVVSTPKNYYWYMDNEGLDFIPASPPDIIVRSITEDNIRQAVESYLKNDAYWLKLYFLAGKFKIEQLNQMMKELEEANRRIFEE